jgi:murein DD-endopeptidase MepM/ murein hydrolase activator NlpD
MRIRQAGQLGLHGKSDTKALFQHPLEPFNTASKSWEVFAMVPTQSPSQHRNMSRVTSRAGRTSAIRAFCAILVVITALAVGDPEGRAAGLSPEQMQLQTILAHRHYWEKRLSSAQHQEWLLQKHMTSTRTKLTGQKKKLNTEHAQAAAQQAKLTQVLQADQLQVQSVQTQLESTRSQYKMVHRQAHGLLIELRRLKARIRRETRHVQTALVQMYELSQVSPLETVLEAKSLTQYLGQQNFVGEIGARDSSILQWARREHTAVYAVASIYIAKMTELRALQAQEGAQLKLFIVETQRENLLLIKAERLAKRQQQSLSATLAGIRSLGRVEKHELTVASLVAQDSQKAILADQQAAERVAFIIGEETGVYPSIGSIPGMLQWPLVGPIAQGFGPSPYPFEPTITFHGVTYAHFHTGIDIDAPFQTPIRAAAAGRVIFAQLFVPGQPHLSYGLCVIIEHSAHLSTLYAHMDLTLGLRVHVGQIVAGGQVIGYEGVTGNTTGPHLHFEVRVNGEFVNPLGLLPPEPPG